MPLLSLNPYDANICEQIVSKKFDSRIKEKYGAWKVNDYRKVYTFDEKLHQRSTPRYSIVLGVIPCATFYYLNYLDEIQPTEIVDIGCGMNFFKGVLPNIIGIDPENTNADFQDCFDGSFSVGHTNYYHCAFSIDALHFISLSTFYNRVLEFANIIKPGGRGYLSMNCARIIEHTRTDDLLKMFSTQTPTSEQLASYIDHEIKRLPLKLLVVDNLITDYCDEFVDGNIRLVFEK